MPRPQLSADCPPPAPSRCRALARRWSGALAALAVCALLAVPSTPDAAAALGDSYSSGNAAGWYWDTTCFNSLLNYASRLGWELFVRGKRGYAMTQAPSCSGAQTGRATPPYGLAEGGYFSPQEQRPGYVRAAQREFLTHVYERNDGSLGAAFDGTEVGPW